MFYTANMKFKNKSKLVTYQHGFGYGICDSLYADHEYNISDFFFLRGVGKIIKKPKNWCKSNFLSRAKTANKILFVHRTNKRFPITEEYNYDEFDWIEYLKKLIKIPSLITKEFRKKIVYRVHSGNLCNEFQFLKKE